MGKKTLICQIEICVELSGCQTSRLWQNRPAGILAWCLATNRRWWPTVNKSEVSSLRFTFLLFDLLFLLRRRPLSSFLLSFSSIWSYVWFLNHDTPVLMFFAYDNSSNVRLLFSSFFSSFLLFCSLPFFSPFRGAHCCYLNREVIFFWNSSELEKYMKWK